MTKETKNILILILVTLVYRLIIAANTGLGIGESYYFRGAYDVALSDLDQPALFMWLAHISLKIFGLSTFSIRLPSVLMFSGTTWVLYLIGRYLFSAKSAFYGMLIFNCSALFVISGLWFQPDSALLFFWSISLYYLILLFFPREPMSKSREYYLWIAVGVAMGLTTLSKYHSIFLVMGMITFILTNQRRWLKHPGLYISLLISFIFGLPILIWNMENHFASFVFQGSRVLSGSHVQLHFEWFFRSFVGQCLWLLPWIWVPIAYQLYKTFILRKSDFKYWFCFCMAVYPVVFFTVLTLWANLSYHFHWQAAGYMILFLPLGVSIEKTLQTRLIAKRIIAWMIFCAIFLYGLMSFAAFHMETGYWQTYGPKWMAIKTSHNPTATDPTLDGYDYDDLYKYFDEHNLFNTPNQFVGAASWLLAGKVDWALKGRVDVRSFQEARNYEFYFNDKTHIGQNIIYITDQGLEKTMSDLKDNCSNVHQIGVVPIIRGGISERVLNIYKCTNFHENL